MIVKDFKFACNTELKLILKAEGTSTLSKTQTPLPRIKSKHVS